VRTRYVSHALVPVQSTSTRVLLCSRNYNSSAMYDTPNNIFTGIVVVSTSTLAMSVPYVRIREISRSALHSQRENDYSCHMIDTCRETGATQKSVDTLKTQEISLPPNSRHADLPQRNAIVPRSATVHSAQRLYVRTRVRTDSSRGIFCYHLIT